MRSILFIVGFSLWASTLQAQDFSPSQFRIIDIRSQGQGCNPGTVALNISSDQQAFTLSFSEFIAELSANSQKQQERKSCRLIFDTEHEAGWEYAVVGVIFRGGAFLDAGVNAKQVVRYGVRGKDAESVMNLQGPLDENYAHADQVSPAGLKWNGCKNPGNGNAAHRLKDFTVDSTISLQTQQTGVQGLLTVDSIDGEVSQTYDLLWRACKAKGPKFAAICRLDDESRAGASRQMLAQGRGKSAQDALAQAKNKLADRCQAAGQSLPLCDANMARCEALQL